MHQLTISPRRVTVCDNSSAVILASHVTDQPHPKSVSSRVLHHMLMRTRLSAKVCRSQMTCYSVGISDLRISQLSCPRPLPSSATDTRHCSMLPAALHMPHSSRFMHINLAPWCSSRVVSLQSAQMTSCQTRGACRVCSLPRAVCLLCTSTHFDICIVIYIYVQPPIRRCVTQCVLMALAPKK